MHRTIQQISSLSLTRAILRNRTKLCIPTSQFQHYSSGSNLTRRQEHKCFGGSVGFYNHESAETNTQMAFSIYLPPSAIGENPRDCSVLYWLSGLTCTEENFITKAGAQSVASELGLIIVCPDTSPRGCNIEGENDAYNFGSGAGFYVDATEPKWSTNYRMYSYITRELPNIIENNFPVFKDSRGIFGHSMGGHGAMICALKNPGLYKSVSAFSPICNPMKCQWGEVAFTGYLGTDVEKWKQYDSCELASSYKGHTLEILADQGSADNFLQQNQLLPENLVEACTNNSDINLVSRMQEGYDHSYYFISSFIKEHLFYHAERLS